jgi:hypothetical protein
MAFVYRRGSCGLKRMVYPRPLPRLLAFFGALPLMGLALAMAFSFCSPGKTGTAAVVPAGALFRAGTQRTSNDSPADEPAPPALCRCASGPGPAALLKEYSGRTGVELGKSKFSISLAPKARSLRGQFPAWFPDFGVQRPPYGRLPLHVLFCTWLA